MKADDQSSPNLSDRAPLRATQNDLVFGRHASRITSDPKRIEHLGAEVYDFVTKIAAAIEFDPIKRRGGQQSLGLTH